MGWEGGKGEGRKGVGGVEVKVPGPGREGKKKGGGG